MIRNRFTNFLFRALPWVLSIGLSGCVSKTMTTSSDSIQHSVRVLSGPAAGGGGKFELAQPWQQEPDARFRSGRVVVSWRREALLVAAELTDDEIFTRSTADNQLMWQLGDVFEIFLQVEGEPGYVELHVSPNNHRLHLRLPNVQRRLSPDGPVLTVEEMVVDPPRFRSSVDRTANGWRVKAEIPASTFGRSQLDAGQAFRVSFCRYDAAPGREAILSTTSAHPVASFHRPEEWALIRL